MYEVRTFPQRTVPETTSPFSWYVTQPGMLLHFDGPNGSTDIIDSFRRNTATAQGSAHIDTSQFVFGGSSMRFNGTTDFIIIAPSTDFVFGVGDFTVDFRVRFNSFASLDTQNLFLHGRLPSPVYPIYYDEVTGQIHLFSPILGTDIIQTTTIIGLNQWYHVALTSSSTNLRLFIDGTQEGATYANQYGWNADSLVLGATSQGTAFFFDGWIDELRVLKGVAAWTSNFTPPTAPYTP